MGPREKRCSFCILLLSGFIDYAGIAIVYPLFAYLLFDSSFHFLPFETSGMIRGLWLGFLISLHPIFQFIFAPIFGSLSDFKGRKKILLGTFSLGFFGYLIAILGILFQSLSLLAIYRILVGISGGNSSVVSATVADLSTQKNKAKNYGMINMSFGAGISIGPFLSGFLAHRVSLIAPFIVTLGLVGLNLILVHWKLRETCLMMNKNKIQIHNPFSQLKAACKIVELRSVFLALLFFSFGWSFYTEFIPLFLIDRYDFSPGDIGLYYGYTGAFYSLSSGFLIFPIIRRLGIERCLFLSMLCSGLYIMLYLGIGKPSLLWFYLPFTQFFLAFAYPSIAACISNHIPDERQGEVMGIYTSIIALAFAVTPFLSGGFIGSYPILTVIVSGVFMVLAAVVYLPARVQVYRSERE